MSVQYKSVSEEDDCVYTISTCKDLTDKLDKTNYALPIDVWFHAEDIVSKDVFLRLQNESQGLSDIPKDVLEDCLQLTKASSSSKKTSTIKVVYTTLSNIKTGLTSKLESKQTLVYIKSSSDDGKTRKVSSNPLVLDKLLKTETHVKEEYEKTKAEFDENKRKQNTDKFHKQSKEEQLKATEYRAIAEQKRRGYTDLFDEESLESSSNQNRDEDWEDNFM